MNIDNVHEALQVYEAIRLPAANKIQAWSRTVGRLDQFIDPRVSRLIEKGPNGSGTPGNFSDTTAESKSSGEQQGLEELKDLMLQYWQWAWTTDPEVDRQLAIELLIKQLSL